MDKKKVTGEIDGLAKGGAILSIVSASIGILAFLIIAITAFRGMYVYETYNTYIDHYEKEVLRTGSVILGVIMLILLALSLAALILNIRFLRKKTDSLRIAAGVVSLISVSLLGGILTLCGKVTVPGKQQHSEPVEELDLEGLGIS